MFCLCKTFTFLFLACSVIGHKENFIEDDHLVINDKKLITNKPASKTGLNFNHRKVNESAQNNSHRNFENETDAPFDDDHSDHYDHSSQIDIWLYATISVLLISIIGLFSVLFIPLMKQHPNSYVIQLLVGLAIGTLTSDALIHLLPHALSEPDQHLHDDNDDKTHNHEEHLVNHYQSSQTGLIAVTGVIAFLTFKRLFSTLSNANKALNSIDQNHDDENNNEKLVGLTQDIYLNNVNAQASPVYKDTNIPFNFDSNHNSHYHVPHHHPHSHHHHHHHHDYFTNYKNLSAIFTIITGDGLHNFCDGLAIGVAFQTEFYIGLSTSIAILCHELPHEIGDFAVLINAGLPIKSAIKYNIVSSVLAFIGMSAGILIGNIFDKKLNAIIAGMFLYIALVDMVPQLETENCTSKKQAITIVLVQLIGIVIGTSIMFLVAIYEV